MQKRALRIIQIVPFLGYSKALGYTKLLTLKERRDNLCDDYFAQIERTFTIQNFICELRSGGSYKHYHCKTDRLI